MYKLILLIIVQTNFLYAQNIDFKSVIDNSKGFDSSPFKSVAINVKEGVPLKISDIWVESYLSSDCERAALGKNSDKIRLAIVFKLSKDSLLYYSYPLSPGAKLGEEWNLSVQKERELKFYVNIVSGSCGNLVFIDKIKERY